MQAISYRHENRMKAGHFVYSKLIVKRHDNGWYPLTYFEVSGSICCYVMSYFKVSGYHPLSCHVLLQSKWIPSAVMPLHYQLTVHKMPGFHSVLMPVRNGLHASRTPQLELSTNNIQSAYRIRSKNSSPLVQRKFRLLRQLELEWRRPSKVTNI